MSWQDRDYSLGSLRQRAEALGIRRPPTVTLSLIVLHLLGWAVVLLLRNGALGVDGSAAVVFRSGQHPLAILLHPFASGSVFTLLFVAFALWSLGASLEPILDGPKFLAVYVVGNLAAGAVFHVVMQGRPAIGAVSLDYPAGALAAMVVVAWRHLRWEMVSVFGRWMSLAKVYAICAAIAVGLMILRGPGAIAWVVAVAGGAAAGASVEYVNLGRFMVRRPRKAVATPRGGQRKAVVSPDKPAAIDVDEILAKISRSGLASLTEAERARLEAARRARLRSERDR